MKALTGNTWLVFKKIKNGARSGETFENTVGNYITAIRHDPANAEEFVEFEIPLSFDANGEPTDYRDTFKDLSLFEQLELCIARDDERFATRTSWVIYGGDESSHAA